MLALLLLSGLTTSHAQVPLPTFPDDWSSKETINQVIYQGSYVQNGDSYCCGQDSTCQLQLQYEAGTRYFSYSTKQSRFDDEITKDVTIMDYKQLVEVAVDENMVCTAWCPLTGGMSPFDMVESDATHMGTAVIDGKTVQHWQYVELGPLHVKMQTNDYFVDQSDQANCVPVLENQHLTPFKIDLGTSNESWTNFKAGKQDASLFNFTQGPASGCPRASNCGSSSRLLRRHRLGDKTYSLSEIAAIRAQELQEFQKSQSSQKSSLSTVHVRAGNHGGKAQKISAAAAPPVFPQDYYANVKDFLVLPQGDFYTQDLDGGESWCIHRDGNGKIQTQFQAAPQYVSYSTNQTRMGGAVGANAVVSDYNKMKQFAVDGNNDCTSYCPIDDGSNMVPLVIADDAKDLGPVTLDGKTYQHFRWNDVILHVIVMDTVDAFIDMTDPSTPVPYLWMESLTPFNKYLASVNTTYTNFQGGKQSSDLFAVNNIDKCPLDANCQPTTSSSSMSSAFH